MKKIIVALLLTLFLVPLPLASQNGAYNTISGIFWCKDENSCYHEIGHKLDQQMAWPSRTKEFSFALRTYIFSSMQTSPHDTVTREIIMRTYAPSTTITGMTDINAEAYAIIFEIACGDKNKVPEIFREFYDWKLANKMITKYIGE